jgi:hypothetical protein
MGAVDWAIVVSDLISRHHARANDRAITAALEKSYSALKRPSHRKENPSWLPPQHQSIAEGRALIRVNVSLISLFQRILFCRIAATTNLLAQVCQLREPARAQRNSRLNLSGKGYSAQSPQQATFAEFRPMDFVDDPLGLDFVIGR